MKQYFIKMLEYDYWANNSLLDLFEKQFPQNQRIYDLFSHILSAQKIWLDRCLGLPQTMDRFYERLPAQLRPDLDTYTREWLDYMNNLDDEAFVKLVKYSNSTGQHFNNKLSDIVAHVVNHGTHHRGSIMTLMKEEGFVLPMLDYIAFVR